MPRKMTRAPKEAPPLNEAAEPHAGAPAAPASEIRATDTAAPGLTSKIAMVRDLLAREEGATLADLSEATGWQPHTVRAALTGLRKKGALIDRQQQGGVSLYRITAAR